MKLLSVIMLFSFVAISFTTGLGDARAGAPTTKPPSGHLAYCKNHRAITAKGLACWYMKKNYKSDKYYMPKPDNKAGGGCGSGAVSAERKDGTDVCVVFAVNAKAKIANNKGMKKACRPIYKHLPFHKLEIRKNKGDKCRYRKVVKITPTWQKPSIK
jgi:hypothetical protein